MGLVMKKDDSEDNEYIDGIEVIGQGEGPKPEADGPFVELHNGPTAEDISGKTAAAETERELEADPELLDAADEDADVELDADSDGVSTTNGSAGGPGKHHKLYIALAVIAVVAAAIVGYVIGSGGFGQKGTGSATLTEDQLDTTVAAWTIDGSTHKVSAREAIESQYSLDSVKGDDDAYPAPSAEVILSYARNQVLLAAAEKQGLTIDDSELAAAAEQSLGTSDFETIASQYQVTEEQAQDIVRQQATIQKLYGTIVKNAPTAPTAPEEPADGDSTTATADYAAYILDLAGDEWDEEAGTWADSDGTYATAFSGDDFDGQTATYEQAQKAYAAAYQDYATEASSANQDWTAYVNGLFAKANITLYGLFA